MRELQKQLLALSADAYSEHQSRGDRFALRVADVTAGLALKVKQLVVEAEQPNDPFLSKNLSSDNLSSKNSRKY